jgi:hypothetical protein
MSKWRVPCDKCGKRWVTVDCQATVVYDELTMGGRPVVEIERNAQDAKRETLAAGKQWGAEDWEAFGVDARGRYTRPTLRMPRHVIRYDKVTCQDCRGSKKKMEKVEE